MDEPLDKVASETIDLLEARLRRIEYAVCGEVQRETLVNTKPAIATRLADMERSLHQLAVRSNVVQDLLKLHARYPDLFQSIPPNIPPTSLDTSAILSIVLASASSYPETASRLTSIRDTPIPPTELSTELINLKPRIARVEAIQVSQDAEIRELRERSAIVVEGWYKGAVIGAGEVWAELEGRVQGVEGRIRRAQKQKEADD